MASDQVTSGHVHRLDTIGLEEPQNSNIALGEEIPCVQVGTTG